MTTDPRWSVGIVIPARDEEAAIGKSVESVICAVASTRADCWIVVVADSCQDETADRARRALGPAGEVHVVHNGTVGAARRAGCERALEHFATDAAQNIWLLSTDADSTVPQEWIAVHCAEASLGAVAVAGTVAVASFAGRPPRVQQMFERRYAARADVPHLHGTNLGVRADAYTDIGGWRSLVTGEDHDLWTRLCNSGHRVVSTTLAPVSTSSRRRGRAPSGFAAYLNALEALPERVRL